MHSHDVPALLGSTNTLHYSYPGWILIGQQPGTNGRYLIDCAALHKISVYQYVGVVCNSRKTGTNVLR